MARKLLTHHQNDLRAKIQADVLIRYLREHAEGKREMSATQVKAAQILLDKSISNAPTEINASVDGNLTVQVVRFGDHPTP